LRATTTERCRTPVVLLVFRRPDVTRRVFEEIRRARPPVLLVVADAPRDETNRHACAETRAVTEAVDWDCEVLRDYAEANMGCRRRVSSGIEWALSHVEEAIILEDDCMPHPSFFRYCDTMLERYRGDERIAMVSGGNFQDGIRRGDGSYYFSRYSHVWGWATWRRAWRRYDGSLDRWPAFRDSGGLERTFEDPLEVAYWRGIFDRLRTTGQPDTWDYQWAFTNFADGALSVMPNVNLVSNIGFGAGATNTAWANRYADLPTGDLGNIVHPSRVLRDIEADAYTFEHHHGGRSLRREKLWHRRLKRRWNAVRRRLRRERGEETGSTTAAVMTTEEAVLHLRRDPAQAELLRDSYLDGDVRGAARRFASSPEFAEVLALLGGVAGRSVLDVGAGTGIASYAFAAAGARRVVALEPDPSHVIGQGAIHSLGSARVIEVVGAFGEQIPFDDGEFDVVYARQVLHHARDLDALVAECARLLRPGGRLLVCREHVVNDGEQLREFLANHAIHRLAGLENAYPLAAYLAAIERANLDIERVLGPWDSIVNAFPSARTPDEVAEQPYRVLRRKYGDRLGRLAARIPWFLTRTRRKLRDRGAGRMYSFVAVRPAEARPAEAEPHRAEG
jgi:SAM-dependent methyltransferase